MSDENTDHTETKTFETWTFAGERVGSDGKLRVHVWADEAGREHWFKVKGAAYSIGGRYKVPVNRRGDEDVSLYSSPAPEYVERLENEARIDLWKGADQAAKTRQARRRREARDAAEQTRLDRSLDHLRSVLRNQRTSVERAALLGYYIEQITKFG